ncbi:MAG: DNA mismatch repair endonuclease MutL [Paludibacteraceae bacterium]|nr:DNA mismatch repair endonuclease MutL [Paludibacteraceae bacterium]MCR5570043.1 DNA mismatch repair endonuclease MutL [Paludibacteraceae bacterium]
MDIIHLLPDTVANQIAAGEVVQRPASAVKELVENAIDAGAKHIQLIIKEAGRNLVQVIDDGKGMSPTDARMAFERHATSKIRKAEDLFTLMTMGFRGEALASIAAVAQVELVTRQADDEMGTHICINGGKVDSQEPCTCPVGTNVCMKNLFYNIPARRNFLKSNATEFGAIDTSFKNIALVYPDIAFDLVHNDQKCYILPATSLRERITHIFGKNINNQLYSISAESDLVKIHGFIGSPETAKQRNDKQFFFVNGRYMKHPYFQKAVNTAYDRMIAAGTKPTFFIYLDVDPASIDVNVHPTKTEIKFKNEQEIFPIILAAVRAGLGRCNVQGSIDFDTDGMVDIPSYLNRPEHTVEPKIHTDNSYNPFNSGAGGSAGPASDRNLRNWESLYEGFESGRTAHTDTSFQTETPGDDDQDFNTFVEQTSNQPDDTDDVLIGAPSYTQSSLDLDSTPNTDLKLTGNEFLQYQNKYILTQVKSGLMCIDQHRAHFRILYDRCLANLEQHKTACQRLLYPEQFDLSSADALVLEEIKDDLAEIGYDISSLGNNTFMVGGVPANNGDREAKNFITDIIEAVKCQDRSAKDELLRTMAMAQARSAAIRSGQKLQQAEVNQLINDLFSCSNHTLTPDNKTIIAIIGDDDISKRFR